MLNQIIHGDCLEEMKHIPDNSIDMILCDLPYGTTACKWDVIIPFDRLWEQYKRIVKPNAAIVLTASQPFTSQLVMSNLEWFKYELIWDKKRASNFLHANKMPLKQHENILLFSKDKTTYNPEMRFGYQSYDKRKYNKRSDKSVYLAVNKINRLNSGERFPKSILEISKNWKPQDQIHPTQKPVALFEYLIKTYTNEGDLILDNCAGSGTTAVACKNLNRTYICIEKEKEYFDIACDRISQPREYSETELETMELKQPEFKQLSLFDVA